MGFGLDKRGAKNLKKDPDGEKDGFFNHEDPRVGPVGPGISTRYRENWEFTGDFYEARARNSYFGVYATGTGFYLAFWGVSLHSSQRQVRNK